MQLDHTIKGIHHVALISPQVEVTSRFYVDVLGLHRIDQVGPPRSTSRQMVLGDDAGTLVTVTESNNGPPGQIGIGTMHHVALTVDSYDALLKWKRWLDYNQIPVLGPYNQQAYHDIVFTDPDGVMVELATRGPGWKVTQNGHDIYSPPKETIAPYRDEETIRMRTWREPVTQIQPDMMLRGIHHVATIVSSLDETDAFYREVMEIPLVRKTVDSDDPEVERWYWGLDGGRPGTLITAFPIAHPHEGGKVVYGRVGPGVAHHFALDVESDTALLDWRVRLTQRGIAVTGTLDKANDRSIFFHDPDGQMLEMAATVSGQVVDEPADVPPGENPVHR
jgi:catechol 2,3-dioxygenase-like lactoylglutathione lyase family enzyme